MSRILKKLLLVVLVTALFLVHESEGAAALSKSISDNDTTASTLIYYSFTHNVMFSLQSSFGLQHILALVHPSMTSNLGM